MASNTSDSKPRSLSPSRPSSRRRLSVSRANLLSAFYAVEGLVGFATFAYFAPRLEGKIEVLVLLMALRALSELMPISIYGDSQITPGFVFTTAIIVLFGPAGVVIASPIIAALGISRHHFNYMRLGHGASLMAIAHASGALAYQQFAEVNPEAFHVDMVTGVLAAIGVSFVVNAVLVCAESVLRTGQGVKEFWDKHAWLAPNYLTLGLIGLALATAQLALGTAGILAFVAPALMMRLSMKQYVEKTRENVEKLTKQNEALRAANIQIRQVSEELKESYDGTLEALVNALDARDQETKGHSIRVSRYMMDIARAMGVREGSQEWVDMQRGSLLHDVGKIGVSDAILLKPGKLTDSEWAAMRLHPEIGYNMLRQVKFLAGAAEIILAHHERWDGKGYPRGLREEEIPLGARIFMVVDTFDSMTSDRPYRKALSTLEALNEILRYSGSQFDPTVVEAFLDIYDVWVKEREELMAAETFLRAA